MKKIEFFDTTLRDGEQSPGCSMSATEKLTLAKQLERLGVNTIEAGFAASSPGDFESVKEIGQQIKNSTVVSLCRCYKNDIDIAIDALNTSKNWGIHTFISTSELQGFLVALEYLFMMLMLQYTNFMSLEKLVP